MRQPVSQSVAESLPQYTRKPVEATGALDGFEYEDATPAIGRKFHNVNIINDLMNADNADERLRELALTSKN